MSDSRPKGAILSGVGIDVDPLMVIGCIGEHRDLLLGNGSVGCKPKIDPNELFESIDSMNWCWHAFSVASSQHQFYSGPTLLGE